MTPLQAPSFGNVLVQIIWVVLAIWLLRRFLCWFLKTEETRRKVESLESLVRSLAAGLNVDVPVPVPVVRPSNITRLRSWCAAHSRRFRRT